MHRRLISFLCAAGMLLSLTACGKSTHSSNRKSDKKDNSSSGFSEQTESSRSDDSEGTSSVELPDDNFDSDDSEETSSGALQENYYRSDQGSKGEYYWLYSFGNGQYRAKAYSTFGSVLTYKDQGLIEFYEEGTYTRSGNRIEMTPKGGVPYGSRDFIAASPNAGFSMTVEGDILIDENGNEYYPGKPWTENPSYETSVVLADTYAQQGDGWFVWVDEESGASAVAYLGDDDYNLYVDVQNTGPDPWSVQPQYGGLTLEQNSKYRVSFEYYIQTDGYFQTGYDHEKHKASCAVQHNGGDYQTYYEQTLALTAQQEHYSNVDFTFIMTEPTDDNAFFALNAGGLGNTTAKVSIKNLKIEKLS